MSAVGFRKVTKRFGTVTAVDALDLQVDPGEFLVLLGPSGCGKSTALRMIAGLEDPTEGDVLIGDRVVNEVDPAERDVAMVFQSYALYPHKTVRANIEFPLRARKVPAFVRDERVREAAEMLGLVELLDRKPGALSGGQRQRVALARAIVRQASVFLMDEPLSNLDAKLRAQTRAEIVGLHHRLGSTFVYVTHDQVEAMTMGTTVAVLDRGALQQVGPPQQVYDRPANTFVAQFIGNPAMNLFAPGVVEPGAHLVGVRPEHLVLARDGVPARVRLVESLGHERLVFAELADGASVVVRQGAESPVPVDGGEVWLQSEPRHRHRFDAVTGARVTP